MLHCHSIVIQYYVPHCKNSAVVAFNGQIPTELDTALSYLMLVRASIRVAVDCDAPQLIQILGFTPRAVL